MTGMEAYIDDFLAYMAADKGCSPRTADTYGRTLRSFAQWARSVDEGITWQTVDTDVARNWMAACMERGENPRTICRRLSALRSFYKYLLRTQRVSHDPVRLIRSPKTHAKLPTFLKKEEVNRLFDEVEFADDFEGAKRRTILLTFYHTGMRVSELVGLNVQDVDLGRREVTVTGKGSKQRIIPFGEELAEAMATYLQRRSEKPHADNALFTGNQGRRISVSYAYSVVRNYLTLVTTQKKKSPHVLRHTYATALLNNGADLETIKELLGHESIKTTEVYTHTTFEDLKNEYKLAHPRA